MDTPPAAAVDIAAARAMWAAYAAAHPERVRACPEYTVEQFGDSRRLADELLAAVTDGPKRATSELVTEFRARGDDLPRVGSHWVACDGSGSPRVVLRSIELRIGTFDEVDERFAYDEGEDDRSLSSWQSEHRCYWQRACSARGAEWSEQDEIVLERFAIVWPPELVG
ncbi:ASCH domain-containing protein [Nocardioides sp. cx-173]|uniref:ASCH domain-containing protein n=1 Tax=Nocardioides sp. cx-173 TaxID=2898796 RepID=UPI001E55AA3C|nr:ASCH domain-containing protein [Nocardioides sp. cx-173]MCD4527382.1 ASCH domain-containing protein [Nocardioides sp. cx-173]UGB43833.1 ASCH domain-containing protein [Nocardioides sp. cx-173]